MASPSAFLRRHVRVQRRELRALLQHPARQMDRWLSMMSGGISAAAASQPSRRACAKVAARRLPLPRSRARADRGLHAWPCCRVRPRRSPEPAGHVLEHLLQVHREWIDVTLVDEAKKRAAEPVQRWPRSKTRDCFRLLFGARAARLRVLAVGGAEDQRIGRRSATCASLPVGRFASALPIALHRLLAAVLLQELEGDVEGQFSMPRWLLLKASR